MEGYSLGDGHLAEWIVEFYELYQGRDTLAIFSAVFGFNGTNVSPVESIRLFGRSVRLVLTFVAARNFGAMLAMDLRCRRKVSFEQR